MVTRASLSLALPPADAVPVTELTGSAAISDFAAVAAVSSIVATPGRICTSWLHEYREPCQSTGVELTKRYSPGTSMAVVDPAPSVRTTTVVSAVVRKNRRLTPLIGTYGVSSSESVTYTRTATRPPIMTPGSARTCVRGGAPGSDHHRNGDCLTKQHRASRGWARLRAVANQTTFSDTRIRS
jgi:hypothetical protein